MSSDIKTQNVTYEVNGKSYQGFLADGAAAGEKKPGVLLVHEWWGLNDYIRDRAQELARRGYVAFAVDMFGEGKTASDPQKAEQLSSASMQDPEAAKMVFDKAVAFLKERDNVAEDKIAGIGFCYGGSVVLNMAAMGSDLNLVASFHGGLSEDYQIPKRENNPKIMIFNGAADPMVTEEQITAVKRALEAAGVEYEFENYEGVKHAFTNPGATERGKLFGMPLAYDKNAAEDSMGKFLGALAKL